MSEKIIKINGKKVKTRRRTLINAIKDAGIQIPSLCHHPDLKPLASCRLCIAKVNGEIVTSCNTKVENDMQVETHTDQIIRERKNNLRLILASHPDECQTCLRNKNCELQTLAEEFDLKMGILEREAKKQEKDYSSSSIILNPNMCILCGRCIQVCDAQKVHIFDYSKRGPDTKVEPAFGDKLADTNCVSCGQCALSCPVAAITERDQVYEVMQVINDEKKHVVVQIAPAVKTTMGEYFNFRLGKAITWKLITALRMLGFDAVFDTPTGADLTTMEESAELLERVKKKKNLPIFTSCCPAWVNFVEFYYPEFLENLSTVRSPQQTLGAIIKTYYAKEKKIKPEDIVTVGIMPCTAKKNEARRVELTTDGMRTVDYVLTTRELARMLKMTGIKMDKLEKGKFDSPMQRASSAGVIFGSSGGVMESVIRSASYLESKEEIRRVNYEKVRGMKWVKEATVKTNKRELRVAVVHGLGNAKGLLEKIKKGAHYDAVEVMACKGGCIGGGGQPIPTTDAILKERMRGLYKVDSNDEIKTSYKNPVIKHLYKKFLKKPNSRKAKKLLHTQYYAKNK